MAVDKYLTNVNGVMTEVVAPKVSAGAADANKIPGLNGSGVFDVTFMPPGIGADTQPVTTSEALAAGDFVNIWNSTGAKARKADASTIGKEAHGFVLSTFASGAVATVYFEGTNNQVSGQTPGVVFLATTPGMATTTAPSASGNAVQRIGFAVSSTTINFQSNPPLVLA